MGIKSVAVGVFQREDAGVLQRENENTREKTVRKEMRKFSPDSQFSSSQVPVDENVRNGNRLTVMDPGMPSPEARPIEFPLCLGCQSRRYWLGTRGKVVCSRCGIVRFEIIAMDFRALQ
jgi:hypothetical protein